MSGEEVKSSVCAQVFDDLVEGRDVEGDRAEHLGSCMACFRVLAELRDVPRLAATLRSANLSVPEQENDGFWDDLAARTTAAAAATLPGAGMVPALPGAGVAPAARRRHSARTPAVVLATALAAGWLLFPHHSPPVSSITVPAGHSSAQGVHTVADDELGDATDVGDLDRVALRRLLDRLRAGSPAVLTGSGDLAESGDTLVDDEGQVNDELSELDGPALLRVERSFERLPL